MAVSLIELHDAAAIRPAGIDAGWQMFDLSTLLAVSHYNQGIAQEKYST